MLIIIISLFSSLFLNLQFFDLSSSSFHNAKNENKEKFEAPPDHITRAKPSPSRDASDVLAIWGIELPTLTNADNPGKTIYAGYKPYRFRFRIYPLNEFNNVSSVTLRILDEQLVHTWFKSRSRNQERNSDKNSRSPQATSSFEKQTEDLAYLNFDVTFSWTNSNESGKHTFEVWVMDNASNISKTSFSMDYYVIKTIKFTGELKVQGQFQGVLQENDWVRRNEQITWSGLKVIYNSSVGIELPEEQGIIVLYNDDGKFWEDTSGALEAMSIISQADPKNDLEDEHVINISGPAQEYLEEPIKFMLRVDGDGVKFYNPRPDPLSWQNSTTIESRITIIDNKTSGVDSDSVEFKISKNNGNIWSEWYKPKIKKIDENRVIECYDDNEFLEGEFNLIMWRAMDLVGNQYSISDTYTIRIDKTPLTFSNPIPKAMELQFSTQVNCSIDISDSTSGINASSIQYAISIGSTANWTVWKDIIQIISTNNNSMTAKIIEIFDYGEHNYLRWRAKDAAGNGFTQSEAFQIKITHKIPKIFYVSPAQSMLINTTTPTISWNNSYEVLQDVTYILEYWPASDEENITSLELAQTSYTFEKPLKFDTKYYWRVTPKAGDVVGISDSGTWNFMVNSLSNIYPVFKINLVVLPDLKVEITPKKSITIDLVIYNQGNRDDIYQINFITEPIWNGSIEFNENVSVPTNGSVTEKVKVRVPKDGWEYKTYIFKVEITSNGATQFNQTVSQTELISIEIIKEKPAELIPAGMVEVVIIIVIVLVVILIIIFFSTKTKTKHEKYEIKLPSKGDAEIIYTPQHSKAVDLASKKEVKFEERKQDEKK